MVDEAPIGKDGLRLLLMPLDVQLSCGGVPLRPRLSCNPASPVEAVRGSAVSGRMREVTDTFQQFPVKLPEELPVGSVKS